MAISFEIPREIEERLRATGTDVGAAAREAFLVDLYRRREITGHQLCGSLNLTRLELEAVLSRHGVQDGISAAEFERQADAIRRAS